MPRHTGYPMDYVIRIRGNVAVQIADYCGRLRDYPCLKSGSYSGLTPFAGPMAPWSSIWRSIEPEAIVSLGIRLPR